MGKIISITGKTGSGKTTIAKYIFEKCEKARAVQSYTTRVRRDSDLEGDFHYLTLIEFLKLKEEDQFLWTVQYGETWYGTSYSSIDEILNSDSVGVMILLPEVLKVLEKYIADKKILKNFFPIYIENIDDYVLESRLEKRGDEEKVVKQRLEKDKTQFDGQLLFNKSFIIVKNMSNKQDLKAEVYKIMQHISC